MNRVITISATMLLAAALAACGSNPTQPDPAAAAAGEGKRIEGVKLTGGVIDIAKKEGKVDLAKDDRVRCEKYKPIGSNRTLTRCTTIAEQKASEEDNAAAMRKLQAPPPSSSSTIGK